MSKLSDLQFVLDQLENCKPNVEDHSWGPSYELALSRRDCAISIIEQLINEELQKDYFSR